MICLSFNCNYLIKFVLDCEIIYIYILFCVNKFLLAQTLVHDPFMAGYISVYTFLSRIKVIRHFKLLLS